MTIPSHVFRLSFVRPALSALIVATLALGIGSATALYSVIEAVLLRPYPFREQSRIAILWQTDVVRNHPFVEVSYLDARDWATRTSAFESIASMSAVNFSTTLTGMGDPRQLQVRAVSHPFFDVLGSAPILGRTLTADDHHAGAPRVVVIGHGVWQSLYGGDPNVVGRSMTLDNDAHTIVGVMPRDFRYPEGAELWAPVEPAVPAEALAGPPCAVDGRSRTTGERRLVRSGPSGARPDHRGADKGTPGGERADRYSRGGPSARRRDARHDAPGAPPPALCRRRRIAHRMRQRREPAALAQRRPSP